MTEGPCVVCTASQFSHPKAALHSVVSAHSHVSRVQVLLPECQSQSVDCLSISLKDQNSFFLTPEVGLPSIVERITSLSLCNRTDLDFQARSIGSSCCSVSTTSNHALKLVVTQDVYRRLGLPGSPSDPRDLRRVVEIQLSGKSFKPGEKYYEKVMARLKEGLQPLSLVYTLRQSTPLQPAPVIPTLVEGCTQIALDEQVARINCTSIPQLSRELLDQLILPNHGAQLQQLINWIGGIACGLGAKSLDEMLPPSVNHSTGGIWSKIWKGFMVSQQALQAIHDVRTHVDSGVAPWAAILVWGWEDGSSSLSASSGSSSTLGSDYYVVLLLPEGHYCVMQTRGGG